MSIIEEISSNQLERNLNTLEVCSNDGALARVVRSLASNVLDPAWVRAYQEITQERLDIERMLKDNPDKPVYGFSTMLGHLDRSGSLDLTQKALLDAHLMGPISTLDPSIFRLVTLCKIEQAHHKGSGIHPQTFQEVLNSTKVPVTGSGAWWSSYGSGDVVPASWWAHALLESGSISALRTGDTIALINGNFLGCAFSIVAGLGMLDVSSRILASAVRMCQLPLSSPLRKCEGAALIVEAFDEAKENSSSHPWDQGGQAPVSLRDATPLISAVLWAIENLGRSLETTLSQSSANPRFVKVDGKMIAESQSSFLDQRVAFSLSNASQLLQLIGGVAQRFIEHRTASLQQANATPEPLLVQPPKVASAILERLSMLGTPQVRFTGADSEGVEDLRDVSLLSARHVLTQISSVRELLDLSDEFVEAAPRTLELIQASLLSVFTGVNDINPNDLAHVSAKDIDLGF